jgi:hypothetical protein
MTLENIDQPELVVKQADLLVHAGDIPVGFPGKIMLGERIRHDKDGTGNEENANRHVFSFTSTPGWSTLLDG